MVRDQNCTALLLRRQYLTEQAGEEEYDKLFRDMSPMPTEYWSSPGSPPAMYHRADFDDAFYNQRRRARRELLKGRFQGGSIGYVEREEWELFAALYRKPAKMTELQQRFLELLAQEGPLTIQGMKEITGLLVKEITPVIHKLQEAFLVYEDQVDNEGDRAWYLLADEFPEFDLNRYAKEEALDLVLPRFAGLCVRFDADMAKSFYRLPGKDIKASMGRLLERGVLVEEAGWHYLREDFELLEQQEYLLPRGTLLLHRNDFLVKANEAKLKARFPKSEYGVLHYLLIDGELRGVLLGGFKFGPAVLEDLILDLPPEEAEARREEFLAAVYQIHNSSKLARYNGKNL